MTEERDERIAIPRPVVFLLILMMGLPAILYSQSEDQFAIWRLRSLKGKLSLGGEYRALKTTLRTGFFEDQEATIWTGDINMRTESYFIHPKFLLVNAYGEYNPMTRRDLYLVSPDWSEVSTAEKAGIKGVLFKGLPISLSGFGEYTHMYLNRDIFTDVETFVKVYGGGINLRSRSFPLSLSYQKDDNLQNELQTGRRLWTIRDDFTLNAQTSLYKLDEQRLRVSYEDYFREYYSQQLINSKIGGAYFYSSMPIDSAGTARFNTNASYEIQRENLVYDRIQAEETAMLQLPWNFRSSLGYRYFDFKQDPVQWKMHTLTGNIEHRLFQSLTSSGHLEYYKTFHTEYTETIKDGNAGFEYRKKIPFGALQLSYRYRQRRERRQSETVFSTILDEAHVLDDTKIELLEVPFVNRGSVVVTDETQTLVFQENFDYILIQRGNFIEIRRMPGGRIATGETVYVDYKANRNPSYKYRASGQRTRAGLHLFNGMLNLYFEYNDWSFDDPDLAESLNLKTIRQRTAGGSFKFGVFTIGVEFDQMLSNIVPYFSRRVYASTNVRLFNTNVSLSGNAQDVDLTDEGERQKFYDASARLMVPFSEDMSASVEGTYRYQRGRGLDLDIGLVKGELIFAYRRISFHIGGEAYKSVFLQQEKRQYIGGYVRIEREF
ncbi:MAG: hypothetical protein GXO82_09595 [Chlorobi bacterium]|nr:hypothetical protein [Chlorobiota bacterium]